MKKSSEIIAKYYSNDTIYLNNKQKLTRSQLSGVFDGLYKDYKKNLKNFIDDLELFDKVFFTSMEYLLKNFENGSDITSSFYSTFNDKLSNTATKSNLINSSRSFAILSKEIDEIARKFPPYEEQIYNPDEKGNRDKLIKQNLKMVLKKALHYSRRTNESLLDIFSSGCEGLVIAYDRYRNGRGTKFSSYANIWIEGKIYEYLNIHTRTVRIQKTELENIKKEKGHYPPNNSESFYTKASDVSGKSDNMIIDVIGDHDEDREEILSEQETFAAAFNSMMRILDKKERRFIKEYYGIGYNKKRSMTEISKRYDIKKNMIQDKVDKIIQKLNREIEDPTFLLEFISKI